VKARLNFLEGAPGTGSFRFSADEGRARWVDLTVRCKRVTLHATVVAVIESFKHKGLKRLFEEDDRSKIGADWVERIRLILSALEEAASIDDVNQPSFRLHRLKGDLKGHWAVTVRANWRIVFRFAGDKASNLDRVDYH
jgi:proteic killer suppression protein